MNVWYASPYERSCTAVSYIPEKIYQFGKQTKAEMCANLSAILLPVKDSGTKQIISTTLKKLNACLKKRVQN